MPNSDPSFAEKTPENHPFCAHFRALDFGQIALTSSPPRHSPVVNCQPSANDSITQSPDASIPQSPDRSITQFFWLARPHRDDFGFLILDF